MSPGSARETTSTTSADFTDLKCGTTYALGVDAYDGAGLRSTRRAAVHGDVALRPPAAAELDGRGDPDDRERLDHLGIGQLARRLRHERRQGRGRPRHDRVPASTATSCSPRLIAVR